MPRPENIKDDSQTRRRKACPPERPVARRTLLTEGGPNDSSAVDVRRNRGSIFGNSTGRVVQKKP